MNYRHVDWGSYVCRGTAIERYCHTPKGAGTSTIALMLLLKWLPRLESFPSKRLFVLARPIDERSLTLLYATVKRKRPVLSAKTMPAMHKLQPRQKIVGQAAWLPDLHRGRSSPCDHLETFSPTCVRSEDLISSRMRVVKTQRFTVD